MSTNTDPHTMVDNEVNKSMLGGIIECINGDDTPSNDGLTSSTSAQKPSTSQLLPPMSTSALLSYARPLGDHPLLLVTLTDMSYNTPSHTLT